MDIVELFSYDLINKSAYFIYRNKRYNFSFAITDKRLLFLDLDNLIIYGYELSRSSQYKVCNYDKHNNTGDIFFTHLPYNYVFRRLFSRRSSRYLIQSEHVFPEHYEMHHVGGEKYLFNQETLDIVNIRLYGCSAPFQVLEDYILKDRTD